MLRGGRVGEQFPGGGSASAAVRIPQATMNRTRTALLILPLSAFAACGGRGSTGEADAPAVPSAEAPADATPWQPRDTLPGDTSAPR